MARLRTLTLVLSLFAALIPFAANAAKEATPNPATPDLGCHQRFAGFDQYGNQVRDCVYAEHDS